jgi:Tol biopolymer transport system component
MRVRQAIVAALLLALPSLVNAQSFGKNKVQYHDFEWKYLQTEHFDIYFTEFGESVAEFVAETAEQSYAMLKEDFRYELTDRISIIVYNSHNDFQQTNVTLGPPQESVGGFTEFFKNRVVIPYEGDWEKFRHVIHHELTHAVMLQMVFGSGVQSIITGLARLQLPLWFVEGMAEYQSRGWDTESDMFMRDASLNGYVPEIPYLGGFLAYKGGQSVLYYLSEKYGGEKIGEMLGKIKINKSLERGVRQSIGVDLEELSKQWQKYLKREYWPDIADHKEPAEIGKQLTDHKKYRNFINNSPALSPNGDKIAFLSDKSDFFDIYLMSAIDGRMISKLVSGQRTGSLEELHWLRPGISWSPDSRYIVFAAKAGAEDELHVVDVRKRKIVKSMRFGLDGIFSPAWSPQGEEIAFVGTQHGQSDIYVVNVKTKALRKVTDDVFSDLDPSWSPDGKWITFISDRGPYVESTLQPDDFKIYRHDYQNMDVYIVDATATNGNTMRRITDTPFLEKTPVFSPEGTYLAYTSDRTGVYNIYVRNLETDEEWPITDVITGIFHLSWAGKPGASKLAFVSFYNAGYDIFLMKNPLDIKPGEVQPAKTNFLTKLEEKKKSKKSTLFATHASAAAREDRDENKYRYYVFGEGFGRTERAAEATKSTFLDSSKYLLANGSYRINRYKVKFSPDIVYGTAGYSQFFGVQGTTQLALSDVLGNHRLNLFTNLFYDIRNSNYMVQYFYLPKRVDIGVGAFHNAWFFFDNSFGGTGLIRDRYFGASLFASRPFDRFRRLDFGLSFIGIDRQFLDLSFLPTRRLRVLRGTLSYVTDTTLWGITGPVNGGRSRISLSYSPRISQQSGLQFATLRLDWRRYYKIGKEYNFVVRFTGGLSEGANPETFFLGGVDNWINFRFRGGIRVSRPEDIWFSSFETPFRGGIYYEDIGNRFVLTNLEFRFPLLRYLLLGWPLPIGLQNVRGALFTDIGGAWDGKLIGSNRFEDFQPFSTEGGFHLKDLALGYGFGIRTNLGFVVLRLDWAWRSNLSRTFPGSRFFLSIGPEF